MTAPLSPPSVRYLEITAAHTGQRLDNFLLRELKGAPKSLIYRIVRTGDGSLVNEIIEEGFTALKEDEAK